MADRGRGGGFGGRGGDRRPRGRGRGRRGGKSEEKEWQPVTKLGRLVKAGKINSMEEIYLHSLPIKEFQIVDHFLKDSLKDEVMKVRTISTYIPTTNNTKRLAAEDNVHSIAESEATGNEYCEIGLYGISKP